MRQKDQSIRKFEQEIDSLQFRNDQVQCCANIWAVSCEKGMDDIFVHF